LDVDILFFNDCPNSAAALARVHEAVEITGVAAKVRMIEIRGAEDAIARRFLGSPTVRIDGRDIEHEASLRKDYGFMCRTYRASDGSASGAPSVQLIVAAIKAAVA